MLAIWALVPLPFLKPAWTSGSSRFTYCWSLAWRILRITLLACEMSAIMQWFDHSLVLSFFGIGMKIGLFQSCVHCWVFQICWHYFLAGLLMGADLSMGLCSITLSETFWSSKSFSRLLKRWEDYRIYQLNVPKCRTHKPQAPNVIRCTWWARQGRHPMPVLSLVEFCFVFFAFVQRPGLSIFSKLSKGVRAGNAVYIWGSFII